ncbi:MAG: YIP1 family protein [Anaerolineae bacterium]|nr:YIP1 family protein [Anaerolineae bacterium]
METTGAPTEKKNVFGLLLGILVRPKTSFNYLKDNHKRAWWLPAILMILLTIAPMYAASRVTLQSVPPMMEENLKEMGPLPVGRVSVAAGEKYMMEPPVEQTPTGPGIFGYIFAVLGLPVSWLLWGGALYLSSVFLGRSSTFGQMFRLTVWTWLPYGMRGLVQTIYIFVTQSTIVNPGLSGFVNQNQPAMIAPGPGQLALSGILKQVDIYLVWYLLLSSLGLMVFTGLKRSKAFNAVIVIWIVLALLGIVPAIFGGMFQGITGGGGGIG